MWLAGPKTGAPLASKSSFPNLNLKILLQEQQAHQPQPRALTSSERATTLSRLLNPPLVSLSIEVGEVPLSLRLEPSGRAQA